VINPGFVRAPRQKDTAERRPAQDSPPQLL
jgi:hypothetical protein